jgi:hypothetical protein
MRAVVSCIPHRAARPPGPTPPAGRTLIDSKEAQMTSTNDWYASKMAETAAALSGGRVSMSEVAAHAPRPEYDRGGGMFGAVRGQDVGAIMRQTTLSGTHEVRVTQRGSWEPRDQPAAQPYPYRFVGEGCPRPTSWDPETLAQHGATVILD